MKNDLIYRKDAYENLIKGMFMTGYTSRAIDCISEYVIPAVDTVEAVRCKDCKFYTARNYIEKTGICTLATRHLGDDGYCSEGEKKVKHERY